MRRVVRVGMLGMLTAAVFTARQRNPWASAALRIHEQLVGHCRDQVVRLADNGTLTAPYAEATSKALAIALGAFAVQCDAENLPADALAASEEAVGVYQRLAGVQRGYLPDLADALRSVANCYDANCMTVKGLAATEQAVATYRQLASTRPELYSAELAVTLNLLATRCEALGRPADALLAVDEAVNVYRRLASASPDQYTAELATGLHTLAIHATRAGRNAAALAAVEEAAMLRRSLAQSDSEKYLPDLAASLYLLAKRYDAAGQDQQALAALQKATTCHRRLADKHPNAFRPDLAANLIELLSRVDPDQPSPATLDLARETVGILRWLASGPAAHSYQMDLASCLLLYGQQLHADGREVDHSAAIEEAAECLRRLAAGDPHAHRGIWPPVCCCWPSISTRSGSPTGPWRRPRRPSGFIGSWLWTIPRRTVLIWPTACTSSLCARRSGVGGKAWRRWRRLSSAISS
ncbi:hypothetical protein ACFQ9X_36855 [Catenulispora yoronensis]